MKEAIIEYMARIMLMKGKCVIQGMEYSIHEMRGKNKA